MISNFGPAIALKLDFLRRYSNRTEAPILLRFSHKQIPIPFNLNLNVMQYRALVDSHMQSNETEKKTETILI